MDKAEREPSDFTLDPADWTEFRRLGHRIIDDLVDHWSNLRERPVWQPVPEEVKARLRLPLGTESSGATGAYTEFYRDVWPFPRGNFHPRFWGWVNGSGLPLGIFADLLASAMNCSVGAFENSATMVEEQVLGWLTQMLDMPAGSGALLTSGCSMSNLIGLAVARHAKLSVDVRREGLVGTGQRFAIYCSSESHSSIDKAVELLGFGTASLRKVATDAVHRIDMRALRQQIASDRGAGLLPICVVGNAGTVNTGATDPLEELADLCAAEELWFHIDGAFGALAWLCPSLRPALAGLQRADSLAFDMHKWLYLPYDVGCVMVADAKTHEAAFATTPAYLSATESGPASYPIRFSDRGIELTRRFRALKVWLCLKAYGAAAFARMIETNVRQAAYLAEYLASYPKLEVLPAPLNVVCCRYRGGLSDAAANALNQRILTDLQTSGLAVPSHTIIDGKFFIRLAITNHRTTRRDLDVFVEAFTTLAANADVSSPLSADLSSQFARG